MMDDSEEDDVSERFQTEPANTLFNVEDIETARNSPPTSRLTCIMRLIHLATLDQPLDMGGQFDAKLASHDPIWRYEDRVKPDDGWTQLKFRCTDPYLVVVKNTTKQHLVVQPSAEQIAEFNNRILQISFGPIDTPYLSILPEQVQPLFQPSSDIWVRSASSLVSFVAFAVER